VVKYQQPENGGTEKRGKSTIVTEIINLVIKDSISLSTEKGQENHEDG
jgi:hypothetical protein